MTKYGNNVQGFTSSSSTETPQSSSTINSDHFSTQITNHKLNGQNYLQWSQSVRMFICGKSKEDFLSITAAPKEDDPSFKSWKANNNMVMSWLINSMTPDIGENFLLYSTAAEIWEAAGITFSSSENTSEVFETESILHELRQGDMSVTQFFTSLNKLWQKIDLIDTHRWKCPEDEKLFRSIVEKKRVFKFLSGLNKDLDDARGRVLSTKPLPSIREAFSAIRHEESRRKIMMGDASSTAISSDVSALSVSNENYSQATKVNTDRRNNKRPYCDHCHKPGHTKDSCWQIHGKPRDWKPRKNTSDQEHKGNLASSPLFSKEQLDLLQTLFSQSQLNPQGQSLGEDDWQC
ncbi:unnamed protein product [Cuscuta epithymum]|uniref:Retrotransposon Copia-like N-terminal domain-containing protein n=1 Tax=Cuscuta epithymum TaxID=186058 RepID=A0AAV0EFD5_9ASTE|nr:unnamed protein product [Cuscuta epithymum]